MGKWQTGVLAMGGVFLAGTLLLLALVLASAGQRATSLASAQPARPATPVPARPLTTTPARPSLSASTVELVAEVIRASGLHVHTTAYKGKPGQGAVFVSRSPISEAEILDNSFGHPFAEDLYHCGRAMGKYGERASAPSADPTELRSGLLFLFGDPSVLRQVRSLFD
jgi:hypothetical protein